MKSHTEAQEHMICVVSDMEYEYDEMIPKRKKHDSTS